MKNITKENYDKIRTLSNAKSEFADAFILYYHYLLESEKYSSKVITITTEQISEKAGISIMRVKRARKNLKELSLIKDNLRKYGEKFSLTLI